MRRILVFLCIYSLFFGLFYKTAFAAPYFFVSGSQEMIMGYQYHYWVYLYTDNDTVTAAQTILHFDKSKIQKINVSTSNTRCSFWAPADPLLGYTTITTPYFYEDNKLVIACGFSNPGYLSSNGQGDLIANIQVTPVASSSGVTTLYFSDTLFRYIGSAITPGANGSLTLTVYPSTESANPTPTPYPSPTPVNARTITQKDLNFVDISSGSAGSAAQQSLNMNITQSPGQIASNQALNDEIPPPPALTQRPTEIPLNQLMADQQKKQETLGEVLSIQSLRELLFPGRTQADQTVVFVNLISTMAFLAILVILIWRLIIVSRMNKIKYRHLKDLLNGELSVLESKLSSEVAEENKDELDQQMEEIRHKLEN